MSGITLGSFLTLLFLVLLSGALSYLGDVLGYRLGKKRLSLLGLRPRYTAELITVLTGMFITVLTLTAAAIISDNVRTFIFRMDQIMARTEKLENQAELVQEENDRLIQASDDLKKERDELTDLMTRLTDEKNALNAQMESLSDEIGKQMERISELEKLIENKKSGLIAFTAGQVISYSILGHSFDPKVLEKSFEKLFREIIATATQNGAKPRSFDAIWKDSARQRKTITDTIRSRYEDIPESERSDIIVKVICTNNIFKGEGIDSIMLVLEENEVIFREGTMFRTLVDGTQSREQIAFSLNLFLSFLRERFVSEGIITDYEMAPLTFYDTVTSIHTVGERLMILMRFKQPVTKLGPFDYEIDWVPANVFFSDSTSSTDSPVNIQPESDEIDTETSEIKLKESSSLEEQL